MDTKLPFKNDSLKISISRGALIDSGRDGRDIPYKLYMPSGGEDKKPLIVWSHGLGGGRDGAGFIARFLTEQDFAVLHIQHRGTDTSLWEGKAGHPWDIIRRTEIPRSASLDRFRDVPFVLDNLQDIEGHEQFDLSNIGMSGHSFGALTTQVMAGQYFPDENNVLKQMAEQRFKAGILYSFVPMGHLYQGKQEELFSSIDLPLLFMTGTADDSPVENFDYTYRLPVWEHAGSDEKYLLTLEDGDHMVYNGSRGKLEDNPKRDIHEQIINDISLAFWKMKLKGDEKAENWLKGKGIQDYLANEAEFLKD